ncbi:PREDICTED: AT-hook motif nuclear-localized protein 8-like [Tarenaya hassleriana]|uniref:AT-hook motif nuclear-localized protein 8-like n=1 Tax=Tarenaya hassleriana TaxID=28532 RepID=UPI00053C3596|nr:PREDICTED: AT-hook motif nuclear-localized protein 8-like [Tarenaya hassleriana]XP_010530044.1 PREDICTED: AT-hook motif nuclear-localized protein 8-like [Tarenaya hassleriana]XP_010530045.1 PREDICTED: AT-hook motif nuclear-localized protein 8-like [Tarenaya hassleriana]XP_010530046.1 PREDICTED: AT-hook motif nuclear-localized protein 8-like [Tarenaya hassleriana]
MDSREVPPHLQPPPAMLMPHHTSFHRNPNAMIGPASTSPSIHHSSAAGARLPFGSLQPPPPPPPQMEQKVLDSLGFDGSPSSASAQQSMRFGIEQQAKKKRGRPRKYAPDGNIALGLAPTSPLPSASSSYGGADAISGGDGGGANANSADPPVKRNRGRPPGSGKKQLEALGGIGFMPHVIEVNTGEDIASKVMAFSQEGPRSICILSANGAVSSVTLSQATSSSGVVTYEGQFEIVSMSGSFLNSESNGNANRTGILSVALAGSDGRMMGGVVAGMLVAGSKVEVIVGSFVTDGKKQKQSGNGRASNLEAASGGGNMMMNFGGGILQQQQQERSPMRSTDSSEENENESSSPSFRALRNNNNSSSSVMFGGGGSGNNNSGAQTVMPQQQQQQQQQQQHPLHHSMFHHLWGQNPQ